MGANFRGRGLYLGAVFGEEVVLVVALCELSQVGMGGLGAEDGERVSGRVGHCRRRLDTVTEDRAGLIRSEFKVDQETDLPDV